MSSVVEPDHVETLVIGSRTITFKLFARPDESDVRGNFASGDDEADRREEDLIIERANDGDVWAWALVTLTAECEGFAGVDSLGACSYLDSHDFILGGYYEDMKRNAYAELLAMLAEAQTRGEKASIVRYHLPTRLPGDSE